MPVFESQTGELRDVEWKNGAKAALTFSFDDGFKQTYELVHDLLSRYGLKATFFVPVSYVDSFFYGIRTASWLDWKHCVSSGMEVGSHSLTHREFSTSIANRLKRLIWNLSVEKPRLAYLEYVVNEQFYRRDPTLRGRRRICYEITRSKAILENVLDPYKISSFAYPDGSFDKRHEELVKHAGYTSARGTLRGYNHPESLNRYGLRAMVWYEFTTAETANMWVDKALKNGAWLIEVIHLIVPCSRRQLKSGVTTTLDQFRDHTNYVIARKHLWIDTQQNIIDYISQMEEG